MADPSPVLSVRGLTVAAVTPHPRDLVHEVSFDLHQGECLGLVGESGSGKSLTLRSIIGLLPPTVRQVSGTMAIAPPAGGTPEPYAVKAVRGRGIGMIFQEPMRALNPLKRVEAAIVEPLRQHAAMSRPTARHRVTALLEEVGITDVERVRASYPHQLSGGLRQRVMIAAALACEPRILLCDEPTTALDVTTQAQIVALLKDLVRTRHLSLVFVSHDLGVISEIADRVAVMYAGELVESGPMRDVLLSPAHAYTDQLIGAVPSLHADGERLTAIPGLTPSPSEHLDGCAFAPRCSLARHDCHETAPEPVMVADDRMSRCRRSDQLLVGARA